MRGTDAHLLTDRQLLSREIVPYSIAGYHYAAASFLSAVGAIGSGAADVTVGTKQKWMTGNSGGVDSIPLLQRQSNLVIRREDVRAPELRAILHVLHNFSFQEECGALSGLDINRMGEIMLE